MLTTSLTQQRCWIQRDQKSGKLTFGRLYTFSFTDDCNKTGEGWVTMSGMTLESFQTQPWEKGYIPPSATGSPFS